MKVTVALTTQEHENLKTTATANGKSMSEYVRDTVLKEMG